MEDPKPVQAVDKELEGMIRRFHRARWYAVSVIGTLLIGLITWLAISNNQARAQIAQQHQQITASCDFWQSAGTLPLTPAPGATRPSIAGVGIIASARNTYVMQRCPGHLPPPSSLLLRWTAAYGIQLDG
jgi:hypothetical protein